MAVNTTTTSRLDNVKEAAGGRIERARLFLSEVRNELKRVTWPTQKEVYATTVVVILVSVFFGVYLLALDVGMDSGSCSGSSGGLVHGMTDVATKNWYIVHTYSGFEKKVAESLDRARARRTGCRPRSARS